MVSCSTFWKLRGGEIGQRGLSAPSPKRNNSCMRSMPMFYLRPLDCNFQYHFWTFYFPDFVPVAL